VTFFNNIAVGALVVGAAAPVLIQEGMSLVAFVGGFGLMLMCRRFAEDELQGLED
jgi:hypothetical protein